MWLVGSKKVIIINLWFFFFGWESKVMFSNGFCFLFSKTCFGEYKEKIIFLYFWNKKHVLLFEIKKIIF